MLAVALNGLCLQYASPELRCDRQVVLQAIRCNPLALEHADSRMKRDRRSPLAPKIAAFSEARSCSRPRIGSPSAWATPWIR